MFSGEYSHTLDEKNRLTLPAKLRARYSDGLVLSRGIDGCLEAYTSDEWARVIEARLAKLDPLSGEGRLMRRFYFSGACETMPDKQGRVMVPQTLAESSGIIREVTLTGAGTHLEIWDRETWLEQKKLMEERAADVAERLVAQHN